MSPRSSQINRPVKRLVKQVPFAKPEAMDEASRPIPLDEHPDDGGFGKAVDHCIALADSVKNKPKSH